MKEKGASLNSLNQQIICYQNGWNQKNDFNEAKKLIDDVKVDMNKANVSKEDKKVFNYLNRLITDISNNRVEKENAVERLKKSLLGLDRLKQKQSTAFQNNMIQVVYQLFNSFGFNKEFEPLFSKKKKCLKRVNQILKNQHN